MKSTSLLNLRGGSLLSAFLLLATTLPSFGITLGSSNVIGYVTNAEPSNASNETARLQYFITFYNTNSAVAPDSAGYFINLPFFLNNVPPTLPGPAVFGTTITTSSLGSAVNTPYTYLMAKFGADAVYYYLGGQTGTVDALFIPPELNRTVGSLSHLSLFNPTSSPAVPDTGSTLALMGVALAMVGFLRRRLVP